MPLVGIGKCILSALLSSVTILVLKESLDLSDMIVVTLMTAPAALLYWVILRVLRPFDEAQRALLVAAMPASAQAPMRFLLG
jgi:hypothetical protein